MGNRKLRGVSNWGEDGARLKKTSQVGEVAEKLRIQDSTLDDLSSNHRTTRASLFSDLHMCVKA